MFSPQSTQRAQRKNEEFEFLEVLFSLSSTNCALFLTGFLLRCDATVGQGSQSYGERWCHTVTRMSMRRKSAWTYLVLILLMFCAATCVADSCQRIVSLAPSITETIYALGLDQNLVGVSQFCKYPPDAQNKPKVGGLMDVSYEAILALKPTLVLSLFEFREKNNSLKRLGINVLELDHRRVAGILETIELIGKQCGKEASALEITATLKLKIEEIKSHVKRTPPVRVMIVVTGGPEGGSLKNMYVSGQDGFYSELLHIAGGANVYDGPTSGIGVVSAEGVLKLDPQIIVHIIAEAVPGELSVETLTRSWQDMAPVSAVKNRQIYLLDADYVSIPGPRFVLLLEELARIIGE